MNRYRKLARCVFSVLSAWAWLVIPTWAQVTPPTGDISSWDWSIRYEKVNGHNFGYDAFTQAMPYDFSWRSDCSNMNASGHNYYVGSGFGCSAASVGTVRITFTYHRLVQSQPLDPDMGSAYTPEPAPGSAYNIGIVKTVRANLLFGPSDSAEVIYNLGSGTSVLYDSANPSGRVWLDANRQSIHYSFKETKTIDVHSAPDYTLQEDGYDNTYIDYTMSVDVPVSVSASEEQSALYQDYSTFGVSVELQVDAHFSATQPWTIL